MTETIRIELVERDNCPLCNYPKSYDGRCQNYRCLMHSESTAYGMDIM